MKNYYSEIDKALNEYERFRPFKSHDIGWICSRIDWCWKWRKITESQKDELCERAIRVMDGII